MIDRALQLAWAAGFIDGEGFIGLTRVWDKVRNYHMYRIQVDASQIHEAPIRHLAALFGVGKVAFRKNAKRGVWNWRIMGTAAVPVLQELLPYLRVKDQQARLVIEFETSTQRDSGGKWKPIPEDIKCRRAALWAACCELNGGRALRAERLNEEGPTDNAEGHAIVRSHANNKHESGAETTPPLVH